MENVSTRLFSVTCELVILPVAVEERKYREIFNAVSEAHNIKAYTTLPDGAVQLGAGTQPPDIVRYNIARDKVTLSYEFCSNSLAYYTGLMLNFAETYVKLASPRLFLVNTNTVRKYLNIRGVEDGRDFLIKKVFKFTDKNFAPFGRPLHMIGGRIFFPALSNDLVAHEVKMESSLEDFKTIVVEDKAVFSQPIDVNKLKNIEINVNRTDEFISNNVINFLTQFTA